MSGHITRRRFLKQGGAAVGTLAAGSLLARTGRAAEPRFKVGVVTSLSGENIFGGNLTRRGYDFWAETVNQAGGIPVGGKRYKVEMFYGDAQSRPATGADAAERLIVEEEVDVIFGPYTSGVTLATQPICAKYQVPMISGSAESPNVWKAHPEYNFGMIPAVDLTAGKSLGILSEVASPSPKTAAVIGVNEPFSKETGEGFRQGVEDLGLDLVHYDLIPTNADLTAIVSSLKAQNPDIVAVGAHEEVHINFVKAAKSLNYRPKALIMHYGVTIPAFIEAMGADSNGVLGIAVWTPDAPFRDDRFGTAAEYAEGFFNRWGSEPDYTAAACTASGPVLEAALDKLGKAPPLSRADRQQLNALIAETDITTFYGPVTFTRSGDHYHNNVGLRPMLMQIQNGKILPVGPEAAAKAPLTYPLPAWS